MDVGEPAAAWRPQLGAYRTEQGVAFRVWAPARTRVEILLEGPARPPERRHLAPAGDGMFAATFDDVASGDLYRYLLDGEGPFPDPASRYQPQGVHGPSAVVDPGRYRWSDEGWRGLPLEDAILYELHVGTFTAEGTFEAAAERLPYLADLGVTVVELMPVADFPGSRNWGYDGVSLYAPSRAYGTPDDLRRFVDRAHGLGLAVLLDVVYNHFGPDGAYGPTFSPYYFSRRHQSPWGAAVNLDGEGAAGVRAFFIENALHWLHEYHFDGLRLDATHGLIDDSPRHFVAELADRARASAPDRTLLLVAEDERNLSTIVRAPAEGGWGLDAMWADDLHHHLRRRAAGDKDGYYEDYTGTLADIATTVRQGWFYTGQRSPHLNAPRGTSTAGIPLERMVVCIQNHDQIGNRPFGRRLHHQIEPAVYRALSSLLLFLPETPLLFMGQEWAASSRFLFFTDHHAELGPLITDGRRAEFSRFEAFADPATRATIPDPQALSTFERSRLVWDERKQDPHAGTLALYRRLLRLRRDEPALRGHARVEATALDEDCLVTLRGTDAAGLLMHVLWLGGSGSADLRRWRAVAPHGRWDVLLTTEQPEYREAQDRGEATDPEVALGASLGVRFRRPAALILKGT